MKIEVSNGEILDKLSILSIKRKYINDATKLQNIDNEYEELYACAKNILPLDHELYNELLSINEALWHIEDKCRLHESQQRFDEEFIEIARSVYITNDKRALVKKQINTLTNSQFTEEKSYQ